MRKLTFEGYDRDELICVTKKLINQSEIAKYFNIDQRYVRKLLAAYNLNYDELVDRKEVYKKIQEKIQETNLEKYGTKISLLNTEVAQKRKTTMMLRYGTENALSSSTIRDKIKQTNLEKYGYESPLASETIREKIKQTNLKRYGNLYFNPENSLNLSKAMMDKYGVPSLFSVKDKRDEFRLKSKLTLLKRYGVDNPFKILAVQEKIKKINLEKYGTEFVSKNHDIKTKIKDSNLKKYGYTTNLLQPETIDIRKKAIATNGNQRISKGELNFKKAIEEMTGLKFKKHHLWLYENGKAVVNFELDLYNEEYKLAIEFNGSYWHSEDAISKLDKNYHFNKSKACDDKGIRLIHVFEFYWNNPQKREIYKQLIKNAVGGDLIKLKASKCQLKEISSKEARLFLNDNHLGAGLYCKYNYGLYHNDELVQVESFNKPRFNKNYEYESVRGCSKLGYMIYGGYEKVLKHFITTYNVGSIISYVDFNIFNGKLHDNAGFKFVKYTGPDQWYLDTSGNFKRYWVVRGNKVKDLKWEKERDASIKFKYWLSGSKVYVWEKK